MSHRTIDLLANVGPTLSSPLNQIICVSEILKAGIAGDLNEQQVAQLSSVSAAGAELLGVTRDLIDLAQLEAGITVVAPIQCQVAQSIHAAVALVRPLAFMKRVTLATFSDERSALTVADPDWLERLFATVVSNAVTIAESRSMVTVNLEPNDGDGPEDAELQVTIGVHQSTLTIPHAHGETGGTDELATACERRARGVGLRLALADAIARQFGGRVSIQFGADAAPTLKTVVTLRARVLAPA